MLAGGSPNGGPFGWVRVANRRHRAPAPIGSGRVAGVRRALVSVAVVTVVAVPVVPAFAQGSAPAGLGPVCPATATSSGSSVIAGFSASTLAAGFRYQINSVGLLPVGDATVGNIVEADVPFARQSASNGPLVSSLGSPAYPGDTAANLGSALGTFGFPGLPNDPVVALADYPPSPTNGTSQTFSSPPDAGPLGVGPGSAEASANPDGGTVSAVSASSSLALPGGAALSAAASKSASSIDLTSFCVDSSSSSSTGTLEIAGLISIAGVSARAQASSDGATAVPTATLNIGRVTVAGLPAYIDRNGIHLGPQQSVGAGVVDEVQALLSSTLSAAGISIRLIDPTTTVNGAMATADAGGLDISADVKLPGLYVPGVPSVNLPGAPPTPLSTPPVPLHLEALYGAAQASIDATSVSGSTFSTSGGGLGLLTSGPTPLGDNSFATSVPGSTGLGLGGTLGSGSSSGGGAGAGTTGSRLVALGTKRPPLGSSVPLGWVIVGLFGCALAVDGLLAYARWQLLKGRV